MNKNKLKIGKFYHLHYIDELLEDDENGSFTGLGKFIEEDDEENLFFYVDFEEELQERVFEECDIIKEAIPEEVENWKNNQILDFVDKLNEFINE